MCIFGVYYVLAEINFIVILKLSLQLLYWIFCIEFFCIESNEKLYTLLYHIHAKYQILKNVCCVCDLCCVCDSATFYFFVIKLEELSSKKQANQRVLQIYKLTWWTKQYPRLIILRYDPLRMWPSCGQTPYWLTYRIKNCRYLWEIRKFGSLLQYILYVQGSRMF